MSVVIKGFEKPDDCDLCTLQHSGYCSPLLSRIEVEHGIDPRCPLVEIREYVKWNGHHVIVGKGE